MKESELEEIRKKLSLGGCSRCHSAARLLEHIEDLENQLMDALKEGGHVDINETTFGELRAENRELRKKLEPLPQPISWSSNWFRGEYEVSFPEPPQVTIGDTVEVLGLGPCILMSRIDNDGFARVRKLPGD